MIRRDPDDDEPYERKPSRAKRPDPVRGEVVAMSHGKAYFLVFGCAVGFAVGTAQICIWLAAMYRFAVEGDEFPTPVLLVMGLGFTVTPAHFGRTLLRKVRAHRRIVIGKNCFQILEGRSDDTQVVISIPYENLEHVKCTRVDFGYRLDFELIDTYDPQTYLPGIDVEKNYLDHDYHYAVTESYSESMAFILDEIRTARKQWRKRNEEE